jgi:hypothetical protein
MKSPISARYRLSVRFKMIVNKLDAVAAKALSGRRLEVKLKKYVI